MGTNLAMTSAVCPFCKGALSQDTLRFGGNCPHCMLEIPGEKAPTDPGLQARLKSEKEAREKAGRQKRRNLALAFVTVVFLGIAGAGGVWKYQEGQAALVYEMDDYYQVELSEIKGAPIPEPTAPEVPAGKNGTKRQSARQNPTGSGTAAPPPADGLADNSGTKRSKVSGNPGVVAPPGTGSAEGNDRIGFGNGGDVAINRPSLDKTLTDDAEVYDMAKKFITSYSPQLQTCYNQRLKQVDGLQGAWKLTFTIGTSGLTKDVEVSGVNVVDPELDECMERSVKAWRFQKIFKETQITKTYRFTPPTW